MDKILRKPDLENLVGATERSIRDWERAGQFPQRFKITPDGRSVGWLQSEVTEWLASRAASRQREVA